MSATTRLPVHPAWLAPKPCRRRARIAVLATIPSPPPPASDPLAGLPPRRACDIQRPTGDGTIAGLTDRERDTLRAVCELGTARRAATVLGVSVHAVTVSLRAVASKLGLYTGDPLVRSKPPACYRLGRFDEANGVEPGWFADEAEGRSGRS